jgi:branched-chain amino acid transport system ATP-binding protein
MNDTILRLENLSVRFGALLAVDKMAFEIERGTVTSVIGPNGAGKSTLFNLVSGSIRPAEGRVTMNGTDVTGASPMRMREAGLARSFQITNLFMELSVAENLRLAAQVLEPWHRQWLPLRHSGRALAKVDELIERFELAEKAHEQVGNLSHGEQRRLEIAVALASEPSLLLLDEPTQGMSHGDTDETAAMIKGLAGDLTVLLVEHDIDLVMDLSDKIIVMQQGAKLADGPPEAVRNDPAVQAAYLGHG